MGSTVMATGSHACLKKVNELFLSPRSCALVLPSQPPQQIRRSHVSWVPTMGMPMAHSLPLLPTHAAVKAGTGSHAGSQCFSPGLFPAQLTPSPPAQPAACLPTSCLVTPRPGPAKACPVPHCPNLLTTEVYCHHLSTRQNVGMLGIKGRSSFREGRHKSEGR